MGSSASFKADAVKVVRAQERPIKEIAKDLTIDEGLLRRWLRQADNPIPVAPQPGLTIGSIFLKCLKSLRNARGRFVYFSAVLGFVGRGASDPG